MFESIIKLSHISTYVRFKLTVIFKTSDLCIMAVDFLMLLKKKKKATTF